MAGHLEDLGPSELEFAMARGIGQGERTGLSSNDPWPSWPQGEVRVSLSMDLWASNFCFTEDSQVWLWWSHVVPTSAGCSALRSVWTSSVFYQCYELLEYTVSPTKCQWHLRDEGIILSICWFWINGLTWIPWLWKWGELVWNLGWFAQVQAHPRRHSLEFRGCLQSAKFKRILLFLFVSSTCLSFFGRC